MATLTSVVGRAAAILTNSEVRTTALDMTTTLNGQVTVDLTFTIGSLTNMIVIFYGSADDVTYDPLHNGIASLTETLTASTERMYTLSLPGVNYFKVGVNGTGTVTSSTAAITLRHQRNFLASAQTDGVIRLTS